MKKRFHELSKIEKKNLKKDYLKTKEGEYVISKLYKVLVIGIIGIAFSLYLIISAYLNNDTVAVYIYSSFLLLCSIFFIVASLIVKKRRLRMFYYNPKVK